MKADKEFLKNIGRNIRYYRKRRNLKQWQLAELVDITEASVSQIECGTYQSSLCVLCRIADALHCKVRDLIGDQ